MGLVGIHQHGLNRAIVQHLREQTDIRVDLLYDGYERREEKPLITVETMQNNNEILAKGREAIQTIYRYQIGLTDVNSVDLSINQEKLQRIFNFDKFIFYDTIKSPAEASGFFMCNLTAVVPMPAGDISNKSEYHRVYFDIEIDAKHYREAI